MKNIFGQVSLHFTAALIIAGILMLTASSVTFAQTQPDNGLWTGEYFNNTTLSGEPVFTQTTPSLTFVWGTGSPAPEVQKDYFSARWTKTQYFAGGTYRFIARSDDGIRVYVDNRIILSDWQPQSVDPPLHVESVIPTGEHQITVEYYENDGVAVASVDWMPIYNQPEAEWLVQYYDNVGLAGSPVVTATDTTIDEDWGFGSPVPGQVPTDGFSARYTGTPFFSAGTYIFRVFADDGVRLTVDGQSVIDAWNLSSLTPGYTAAVTLAEGAHTVELTYFEQSGVAAVRLSWELEGGPQPAPQPQPPTSDNIGVWQVDYYANQSLFGPVMGTEQIAGPELALDWGMGSPLTTLPADNFSARLISNQNFTDSPVRFVVRADDGVRLSVDGQLVLDEWHAASGDYYFLDYAIPAGEHLLTLDYYEGEVDASLTFYWVYPQPAMTANYGVTGQVTANLLNVRYGSGTTYPIIGRIARDDLLVLTGRDILDPNWVRVNFDGLTGWVSQNWLNVIGNIANLPTVSFSQDDTTGFGNPTGLRVRATDNVNVREGPDLTYNRIDLLPVGADADVVGRNVSGNWWEINSSAGRGWVSGTYVQLEGDLGANVPITGS